MTEGAAFILSIQDNSGSTEPLRSPNSSRTRGQPGASLYAGRRTVSGALPACTRFSPRILWFLTSLASNQRLMNATLV